jgi:hypothetical protein
MEKRTQILELIERGEISVEEGVRRLEALAGEAGAPGAPAAPATTVRPIMVRAISQAVLWAGVIMIVGASLLVAAVYTWGIATGWLVCGWPLLALGVVVVALGWWLHRARWFSLRVREEGGRLISLALPLPLDLVAWVLRIARSFVPWLRETGIDELIAAMQEELRSGHPFTVEVEEGTNGERVQVFFG